VNVEMNKESKENKDIWLSVENVVRELNGREKMVKYGKERKGKGGNEKMVKYIMKGE